MSFYSRVIFPWICDCLMDNPVLAGYRHDLLAGARGAILEIGFGTGLNLIHYPAHVHALAAVDPSTGMNQRARRRLAQSGIAVDQRMVGGEALPFADATFDCVVSTWTLCSIPAVEQALGEVYRVLKSDGQFLFLERGLSDDPKVQRWQRRLSGIQRRLAEGCRLDLDVQAVVSAQPFREIDVHRFLMEKTPRTHGTMYRGVARK
jgi:ubiquinone/menaquinone biosynthesis C-methylase UbiE